ncbi:MAG: 23S rRNA (guanosine(2251)-2'-O)-methyltransferase RlmB [Nitriliruptorales bacterium]
MASARGRAGADDRRIVPGLHPVRELLRAATRVERILVAPQREESPVVADIRRLAAEAGVPVDGSPAERLDDLAGGVAHQGVVALAEAFRLVELEDLLPAPGEAALLVALDGITDPHNLGAIARTAEAAGAHGLVVPRRRTASVTPAVEKAAAGALAHLPVAAVPNIARALELLATRRVWSVGLAAGAEPLLYECELLTEPVAIVVGAEGRGLSRLVTERCDLLVRLPMLGKVGSLNASVAAAIALYEVRRRRDAG